MNQFITEGFMLGMATGNVCLATCGPVYAPFLMLKQQNLFKSLMILLQISLGRFISYGLFGLFAGFFGREIGSFSRGWFTAVAYLLFSIILFFSAFRAHQQSKGCSSCSTKWSKFVDNPFLLGLVTGINFCPAFLIVLTRAVDLSGPISGMVLFIGFFFGTNVFLVPLSLFGAFHTVTLPWGKKIIIDKRIFNKIAVVSSVLIACWFMQLGLRSLWGQYQQHTKLGQEIVDKTVVTFNDDSPAFIVVPDVSQAKVLREILSRDRDGRVKIITKIGTLPDFCYLIISDDWQDADGKKAADYKAGGRFIIKITKSESGGYSKAFAERVLAFLSNNYFKLNKIEGSIFNLSRLSDS